MFQFLDLIPRAKAAVDLAAFGVIVNPIITNIVYPVIALMFGVAVLFFVYGVIQMIITNDESGREKGKMTILYGTLGMFIMVSAWGIIYLVSNTVKGGF